MHLRAIHRVEWGSENPKISYRTHSADTLCFRFLRAAIVVALNEQRAAYNFRTYITAGSKLKQRHGTINIRIIAWPVIIHIHQ